MRKGLTVLLAAALVAAFAVPALADHELIGFYRLKGHVTNFKTGSGSPNTVVPALDDQDTTNSFIEQRIRLRYSTGTENVKAIAFFEIDMNWGDQNSAVARNQGGALNGDSIDLETKNLYLWFKVPNTTVDVSVGLQNFVDAYSGVFIGNDFAGFVANARFAPVALRLAYGKWFENSVGKADDIDVYMAEAKVSPAKDATVGFNLYYLNDMSNGNPRVTGGTTLNGGPPLLGLTDNAFIQRVWMPGVNFNARAGPVTLSGFAFYQFGKIEFDNPAKSDIDIRGYAADLRGDANLGPGKLFLEGLYISGDDSVSDNKYGSIVSAEDYVGNNTGFYRTDLYLILRHGADINDSQALVGNLNNGGRGLLLVATGFSLKPVDKLTLKIGAGFASGVKKLATDLGKVVGTEVNAVGTYNLAKGLDFSLIGAYAFLGDLYETASGPERVNPYDLQMQLNYAF